MYVTRPQIEAVIPGPHLVLALDDNGDSYPDDGILESIIDNAARDIHGYLAGLFATPFPDPAPEVVRAAAHIFVCEAIYDRRQIVEKNPFKDRADAWRARLEKIGNGELPLEAATKPAFNPGSAITAPRLTIGTTL